MSLRGEGTEEGACLLPGDDTPLQSPRRGVPIHRSPALPTPPAPPALLPRPLGAGAVRGDIQWAAVPGSALTSVSRRSRGERIRIWFFPGISPSVDCGGYRHWGEGTGEGENPPPRRGISVLLFGIPTPPALRAPPPPLRGGGSAWGYPVGSRAWERADVCFPEEPGRASLDPALLRPVPEQWTVVDIAIRGRGPGRGRIPLPAGEYPYSSSALPTPPALRAPPPPPPGGRGSYGDSHHGPVPGDSATSGFLEG